VPAQSEFHSQVERERPYLVRFAALQLRDRDAVEDVVQETLLAALAGEASFGGRSNLRTWLTGILKHKIIDAIRRARRESTLGAGADEEAPEIDALFRPDGHWVEHPAAWSDPDAALTQKQFFDVLEDCLGRLPKKTARVFLMREHLGAETAEICKELDITSTHCWVLLHRARLALQLCLDRRWFAK
jgi:RNA polymerase sigma-70 factor (ECF subfamily)